MKIGKEYIKLDDALASTKDQGIMYTDYTGVKVKVPSALILRLYDRLRHHAVKDSKDPEADWEAFRKEVFAGKVLR